MDYLSEANRQLCQILKSDKNPEDCTMAQITNWQPILGLVQNQYLSPLLYLRLKDLQLIKALPDDVYQFLHSQYLESAAQSMVRYYGFGQILSALQNAQIPVIALKGIYLAQVIYKDPAVRPMADIDILIQPKDIASTVKILQGMGYKPFRDFDIETESKYHRHLPPFTKPGRAVIEVHSSIQDPDDPFEINVSDLWQRAYKFQINQVEVMGLDPHDLLVYLCINISFHDLFKYGLKGLYDIAAVIDHLQDAINWEEIYRRCIDWRAGKAVFITLWLARNLFDVHLPEAIIEKLRPPDFDEEVFSICMDLIFMNPMGDNPVITAELSQFIIARTLKEKVRILYQRLFISRWEMSSLYQIPPNSWRIFLFYPVRLAYLFIQYFATVYGIWRGENHLKDLVKETGSQDDRSKLLLKNLTP